MELCNDTIGELLNHAIIRFGACSAIEAAWGRYSWHELGLFSDVMADMLAERGVARGDHVAIWGGNSVDWILTFLAVIKLEAVAVLINNHYTERELSETLQISRAKWLCYGSCPALNAQPELPVRVMLARGFGACSAIEMKIDLTNCPQWRSTPGSHRQRRKKSADCHDVCCLLFTSGSTAQPKCIMMTHHSLVNNAVSMADKLGIRTSDKICLSTPLFHIFCLCGSFLAGLYMGAALVIPDGLKSLELLTCIKRHRCSVFNGVPTSYLALVCNPSFSASDMTSVRLGVLGGAPVSERQMEQLQSALPQTEFMINYGQTEGGCICNTEHGDGLACISHKVGRPLPHITVAVADAKTGQRLKAGEIGELVVSGYNVMKGFYPLSAASQVIDSDGWLHTEDLGQIDAQGYVSIVGRKKDIMIRGGEDITPREIEAVIMAYEPILDAKVFGVPHDILGEQVVACVVTRPGAIYSEEGLRSWMSSGLASFKIPAYIFRFECFSLCPNGKLDLQRLKRTAIGRVAGVHADQLTNLQ